MYWWIAIKWNHLQWNKWFSSKELEWAINNLALKSTFHLTIYLTITFQLIKFIETTPTIEQNWIIRMWHILQWRFSVFFFFHFLFYFYEKIMVDEFWRGSHNEFAIKSYSVKLVRNQQKKNNNKNNNINLFLTCNESYFLIAFRKSR